MKTLLLGKFWPLLVMNIRLSHHKYLIMEQESDDPVS